MHGARDIVHLAYTLTKHLGQESPGLLAAGLEAGPGLQDQAEPLDWQVGGEHVAVADSGGLSHFVLQDPAAEGVGQGVWLTAD